MNSIKTAWLFDVDGVITDLTTKKIKEPQILEQIIKRLKNNEPIAFVTGRSLEWVEEEVFSKIKKLANSEMFINFFISGEFGGVSESFEDGKEVKRIDQELLVPQSVVQKAKNIAEKFSESMFFDSTKETIVTAEMNDGYSNIAKFNSERKKLAQKFRTLVKESGKGDKFEVQEDTIAVNIRNKKANKKNSAAQVLNWLKRRKLMPSEFICFGDSATDLEMGQEIGSKGLKVRFVFVGKPEDIKEKNVSFPIIQTKGLYENGTLEYLKESGLS